MHPIEVYPLVINVEGLPPGLYHYDVELHTMELLEELTREQAITTATRFTAGQGYFGTANVLFILAARFYRNFWKYRKNGKTYSVILMDAAHLSQTLYLICAQLGLGSFITAAVNGADIEERVKLDGFEEGVLAILGCGNRDKDVNELEPEFSNYVPRITSIN